MSLFRHFLGKGVFCAFLASTCFCLNACLEDDSSSGVAPSEKEQADSTKKQNDSKEQDPISISSEKCPEVTSKEQFLNPDIDYGEVVDERDGRVYKTVKIGKQTWMAENLNYAAKNSLCNDSLDKNCEIYGRKYIDTQDMCPEGWHVATLNEWNWLQEAAGKKYGIDAFMLKSRFGWAEGYNGSNVLGFSMAPLSSQECTGIRFLNEGMYDCVLFAEVLNQYYTRGTSLNPGCFGSPYRDVALGLPIRCVKDGIEEELGPTVEPEESPSWHSETKEDFLNPSVEYGEMTDERDGQTYRTVQIGNQTWMAENLNYAYKVDTLLDEESKCWGLYDSNKPSSEADKVQSCDVFGRRYSRASAVDSAAIFSDDGKGCGLFQYICNLNTQVRGICPEGWRLPKDEDWNTLFETVGGVDIAGKKLKSSVGWILGGNGTDDYGFSAVPSGPLAPTPISAGDMRFNTGFWSGGPDRLGVFFSFHDDGAYSGNAEEMYVRCVKGYTHVDDPSRYIPGVDTSTVVHGTMTDERDGQTYKTIKIGDQTWMAENLNYNYQVSDTISIYGSVNCADVGDSCVDYGRYYTWPAAMDSAGIFSDDGKGCGLQSACNPTGRVRGVCPAGWHLPDSTEWRTLFTTLNCVVKRGSAETIACGAILKSKDDWDGRFGGYDFYGFSVMPAGDAFWRDLVKGMPFGEMRYNDRTAYFWTPKESSDTQAIGVSFGSFEIVGMNGYDKSSGFSIRCVKD